MDLPSSTAADRNKEPILAVLKTVLGPRGAALEIASGTGQHAVWFAAGMQDWEWQPTDADAGMLPVIAARIAQSGCANVREPVLLDVASTPWPFAHRFDAIFCANMLHISPRETCGALMRGAARHLIPGGMLVTYGPYFEDGVEPAPGNIAFDASLRARDASWGIRRLEDVAEQARRAGLAFRERIAMPANNLVLVFAAQG
ncbi:DUF938 domain-containing protein [Ramlibacter sp.]|uniref:DUF938 domain-containing protein n=1 Tax=Ramlibacter sp. TaxID=1917967 RepID=UPI002FCAA7A1